MQRFLVTPVLVVPLLLGVACSDAVTVDLRPKIRFVNATTGMAGSGAFTANGQFAAGSTVAAGQAASTCVNIDAGSTTFGFGVASDGGTGLSGNALATLSGTTITQGGDFIVAATGPATSPQLYLLDANFSGQLGTTGAAVRFVNLAPGPDAGNTYVVFKGAIGASPPLATDIAVGLPTPFSAATAGANTFTILKLPGHVVVVEGSAGTLDLQPGSVNTVAIIQNASGGFELLDIRSCS